MTVKYDFKPKNSETKYFKLVQTEERARPSGAQKSVAKDFIIKKENIMKKGSEKKPTN